MKKLSGLSFRDCLRKINILSNKKVRAIEIRVSLSKLAKPSQSAEKAMKELGINIEKT